MLSARPAPFDAAALVAGFDRLYGDAALPCALVEMRALGSTILTANSAMEATLGAGRLAGRLLGEFRDPDDVLSADVVRERLLGGTMDLVGTTRRYLRPDGTLHETDVFGVVVARAPDAVVCVLRFAPPGRMAWLRSGIGVRDRLLAVLSELRAALLRGDAEPDLLQLICDNVSQLLPVDVAGILTLDDADRLHLAAVDRGTDGRVLGAIFPVQGVEWDQIIDVHRTHQYEVGSEFLRRYAAELPEGIDLSRPVSVAVMPVLASARALGALAVGRTSHEYSDDELDLLEAYAREVGESFGLAELRRDGERLRMLEVREEIGRNLHDEVTQDLIAVRLGLVHAVPQVEDLAVRAQLERSLADLGDATRRLRDVVAGLDETTTAADFADVLRSIASSKAERALIDWEVDVAGPIGRLRDDERAELMRVVNEAVSNVVRHARATRVEVHLTVFDAWVVLIVVDDGVGIGSAAGRRSGLANLEARADARHGGCRVLDGQVGGTRLRWWIPLGDPAPPEVERGA